uniref:Uncharacterized protein n=1 Tax=Anguilla anguilla TaxID=7936 RepID=A0A0E9VE31_ANGAN
MSCARHYKLTVCNSITVQLHSTGI